MCGMVVVVSAVFLAQNWAGFPDPLALSSQQFVSKLCH